MKLIQNSALIFLTTAVVAKTPFRIRCGNEDGWLHENYQVYTPDNNTATLRTTPVDESIRAIAVAAPKDVQMFIHIVSKSERENDAVTDKMIDVQMVVLNHAYRTTGFQFKLAAPPKRWLSHSWTEGIGINGKAMKQTLRKGTYSDLNLYLVSNLTKATNGIVGFCSIPTWNSNGPVLDPSVAANDGCIVDQGALPGGSMIKHNLGIAVVHEVGHWLGLLHPWGNAVVSNCVDGDEVDDTPVQFGPSTTPREGGCLPKTT
jgi:hypothetical protein